MKKLINGGDCVTGSREKIVHFYFRFYFRKIIDSQNVHKPKFSTSYLHSVETVPSETTQKNIQNTYFLHTYTLYFSFFFLILFSLLVYIFF